MISYSQCISLVAVLMVLMALFFYILNKRLYKKALQSHEKYYISVRDYIEQNEENVKMILDFLAIPDIDDPDMYED